MDSRQRYQAIDTLRSEIKSRRASLNDNFDEILENGTNYLPTFDGDADATLNARVQTLWELAEGPFGENDDDDDEVLLVACILAIYSVLEFVLLREQEKIRKQEEITAEERRNTQNERWNAQKRERLVRLRARHNIRLHRIRITQTKQLAGQMLQDRIIQEAEDTAAITTEVN